MKDTPFRIGHGYDAHRFAVGRPLILGGVEIPCEMGLVGHSDADCLLHAVMDSVLGALGLGDIGKHFPDTDAAYAGINSALLAKRVAELMDGKGYAVGNIDATVIAQGPRLAPYLNAMKSTVAELFLCDETCVNIKATTEEKMGFTGRMEGLSAHAVCLLFQKQ